MPVPSAVSSRPFTFTPVELGYCCRVGWPGESLFDVPEVGMRVYRTVDDFSVLVYPLHQAFCQFGSIAHFHGLLFAPPSWGKCEQSVGDLDVVMYHIPLGVDVLLG